MAENTTKGAKHTPSKEEQRGRRKTAIGYVVSDKMDKTIVVELESRKSHPLYGKIIRTTTKVKAHDENGDAGIGDRVSLMETRPLSASKRWRLVEVLERAK
jgi:small subunit ribosomal protein S17